MTAFETAWQHFREHADPASLTPEQLFGDGWDAALMFLIAGLSAQGATIPEPPCETLVATDSPSWMYCRACEGIAVPGQHYCSAHLTPGACDG